MSYTIVQAPGSTFVGTPRFFSMNQPLWHVVSSSNYTQPDFRYIMQVTIGAETITLKIVPDSVGQGKIDLSRTIRSYITNYFGLAGNAPFPIATDAITVEYVVAYGEEYLGTVYTGLVGDGYYAYNCYVGDTPGPQSFEPLILFQHTWATERNYTDIRMPRNSRCLISYINDPEEDLRIVVREVDENGDFTLNPFKTSNVIPTATTRKLMVMDLNLDRMISSPYFTLPPLGSTMAGYAFGIQREDDTITPLGMVRWMCEPKVGATTIHFMNRFGGFDTYHFQGPTRKSLDVESKSFQPVGITFHSTLGYNEFNDQGIYADTLIQYNTQHKWSRHLTSGYVDDATHEWLWQLVASPQVYIELDGYCYPVAIKNPRWQQKLNKFDKMYNLEMDILMGRNVISQSR